MDCIAPRTHTLTHQPPTAITPKSPRSDRVVSPSALRHSDPNHLAGQGRIPKMRPGGLTKHQSRLLSYLSCLFCLVGYFAGASVHAWGQPDPGPGRLNTL